MCHIAKFYSLNQGIKAGHYIGQSDVRCYQPPPGYSATAQMIDNHPLTQQRFQQSQWWIVLTPDDSSLSKRANDSVKLR